MLTPGSPSERRRNTSNVITAGDWAVRLRDWTALMSSVARASVSARVNFPVSLFANVLVFAEWSVQCAGLLPLRLSGRDARVVIAAFATFIFMLGTGLARAQDMEPRSYSVRMVERPKRKCVCEKEGLGEWLLKTCPLRETDAIASFPRDAFTSVAGSSRARSWSDRAHSANAAGPARNVPCPWHGHSCRENRRQPDGTWLLTRDVPLPCCVSLSWSLLLLADKSRLTTEAT